MSIEKLIADAAQRIDAGTAAELLRQALTLDGRVAWNDARVTLTTAERHACDRIVARNSSPSADGNFTLAFRPHGRLYLVPREEFTAHTPALTLLCHVDLSEDDLRSYETLRQAARQALEDERAAICADLEEQGYARVSTEIASAAEHMAPLIYYVGERCISNFYNVGKSGFANETTLAQALQQVSAQRDQADIETLTAAHCLHLVLRSGSYTRLEELNATQLSRSAVAEFFAAKRAFYQEAGRCSADERSAAASLREQAGLLSRMRETIAGKQRFIRLINGTNLHKREGLLPLAPPSPCDVEAPSPHVLSTLQRCLPPGTSVRKLFRRERFARLLGTALLSADQRASFASGFEYLIDRVVAEAVQATGSDIGMSRSTRDYRRAAEVLHRRQTATACGWSQAEYFCHVVPSRALAERMPAKALCTTLNAISARMRFNCWHYMPSYFESADIPADRGWFTAPRMADIADDSDQHHTGHIHAVVRYSIRSPLPLRVGTDVLPGFIDLRVMRQSGEPYGPGELTTAIAYTEVLQFLYQHLMNHVLAHDAGFVFSFGDKKWFDRVYASPGATAPSSQPRPMPQHPAPPAPSLHV